MDTEPAIFFDGEKIGTISNFSISTKLSKEIKLPPLAPIPPLPNQGQIEVTGTLTASFEDKEVYDKLIAQARADEDTFCDWYARTQQHPAVAIIAYEDDYPSAGLVIPLWAGLIAMAACFGIVAAFVHHAG